MDNHEAFSRAISTIYQASLEPMSWDNALVAIADAMRATQSALMVLKNGDLVSGSMPLMDPDHLQTYTEIKAVEAANDPPRAPPSRPLGVVCGFDDESSRTSFENTREYRDWWREHDLGIGALFANVSRNPSRLAQIGVYRSHLEPFTSVERNELTLLSEHLIRASEIHRRVKLGNLAKKRSRDNGHAGFVIVDHEYQILNQDGEVSEELLELGVIRNPALGGYRVSSDTALKELIDDARSPRKRGGSCSLQTVEGKQVWVDVIPVEEGEGRVADWLNIDKPAALLQFTIPQKRMVLRLNGLAKEFGLTPAEKAVAIEILEGDGRAAVAHRLGISQSTVRSHLSVIFEKLGIHRQAQLIRLLVS
ncbi:MAG: LuxR C-terminal-related transcriptional regulator [Pseudomonadota bacterium]